VSPYTMTARDERKKRRAANLDPENVTIIVGGIRKVIPFSEYKKMPEYFPQPEEEE